jgi:hypothetical protein
VDYSFQNRVTDTIAVEKITSLWGMQSDV